MAQFYGDSYQDVGNSISNVGNTLQNVVLGLARQRAQQAMMEREMGLKTGVANAQIGSFNAGAGLDRQKAAQIAAMIAAARNAGRTGAPVMAGDTSSNAITAMMAPVIEGMMLHGNPERASEFGREAVAQGSVKMSPELAMSIMLGGGVDRLFNNVPSGATAVSPLPNVRSMSGGVTIPEGGTRIGPMGVDLEQILSMIGGTNQAPVVARGQPRTFRPSTVNELTPNAALEAAMAYRNFNKLPEEVRMKVMSRLTNSVPSLPSASTMQPAHGVLPQPQTQEEYDSLDPGTTYIDTDGQTKIKGG